MPNWIKQGKCPSCGAPIYVDQHTLSRNSGPEAKYTCECRNKPATGNWSWTVGPNDIIGSTPVAPLTVGNPVSGNLTATYAPVKTTLTGGRPVDNGKNDKRDLLQE